MIRLIHTNWCERLTRTPIRKYISRMAQKNRFPGCWIVVLPLLFLSCSQNRDAYYFLDIDLEEQVQERAMIEPLGERVFSESDFLYPLILEATEDGLFVLDVSDSSRVRRYSWNFEMVAKIGQGTGDGPGEIGGVNDIHVAGDTLYFTDALNALLHQYTIDNEFVKSVSVENEIVDQVTTFGDTLVVRTNYSSEKPLFIDSEGMLIGSTETIATDETRYWHVLQSRLLTDEEYLYRFPVFFGFMVKYDKSGSVAAARHLVDSYASDFDDKTINPLEQPVGVGREDAVHVSANADTHGDNVCVFRFYRFDGDRYIDCYGKSDLAYRFSFIPPDGTRDFQLYKNYFAAIHDSSLTVWEWDETALPD